MKGRISEIFESMQGEGLYVGERQIFVRLAGCNLFCAYCDTPIKDWREYSPEELLAEVKSFPGPVHSVSFTGGEPLVQADFLREALALCRREGYKNYLETNGTLSEALSGVIDLVDFVAMDFKLPSSTGMRDYWKEHRRFLAISSARDVFIKAVVCAGTTEEDMRTAIAVIKEINPGCLLVLQPDSGAPAKSLEERLKHFKGLCDTEKVVTCVIPQIHKIFGVK